MKMNYEVRVTDKSGKLIESVKGENVDEVLKRAAKLASKDFLGYYYEKERMMLNSSREFAQIITDGIKKKLNSELSVFPDVSQSLPEISWDLLLNEFYENNPQPQKESAPSIPSLERIPPEPKLDDTYYQYKFNLKDEIIPFRKKQAIEKLNSEFQRDHLIWHKKKESIEARNKTKETDYYEKLRLFEKDHELKLEEWVNKKSEISDRSRTFKEGYQNFKPFAVEKYCELVLSNSVFANIRFKRKLSLKYNEGTKFLFLEYGLPSIKEFSNIKEIIYSEDQQKFVEIRFSDSELNQRYELILYQITFKALYELFHLDKVNALDEITFRGIVHYEDTSTKKSHSIPVLSVTVKRSDILDLNFNEINMKDCFKNFGGEHITNFSQTETRLVPTESSKQELHKS